MATEGLIKLRLPDVTVACYEIFEHRLAWKVLNDLLAKVEPAEVLVFSDKAPKVPGAVWHKIDANTPRREGHRVLWQDIPNAVKTSHFLNVEWDSGVLDPQAWQDDHLRYDYIGAPWWHYEDYRVGNGGFSLRSTRLMARVADMVDTPEDSVLCRRYQPLIATDGYAWAPEELADSFAFEGITPSQPVFGYHHVHNWTRVLSTEAFAEHRALMSPYAAGKRETGLIDAMALGRRKAAKLASVARAPGKFSKWFQTVACPRMYQECADRLTAAVEHLDRFKRRPVFVLETGAARLGWKEGLSTVVFGRYLAEVPGSAVCTIDHDPFSIGFTNGLTEGLPVEPIFSDSYRFLERRPQNLRNRRIDLLYLDTAGQDLENPISAARHHLKELAAVKPLLHENTLVMVADPRADTYVAAYALKVGAKSYQGLKGAWTHFVRER